MQREVQLQRDSRRGRLPMHGVRDGAVRRVRTQAARDREVRRSLPSAARHAICCGTLPAGNVRREKFCRRGVREVRRRATLLGLR